MRDKIIGTIAIIAVAFMLFSIAWSFNIIPKQLKFDNNCKKSCEDLGWDTYETSFHSYPWSNVNGECYCKDVTKREFALRDVSVTKH